jgi:murein DD-endopeptidase MepM/ murein hydrolase activator NlpD
VIPLDGPAPRHPAAPTAAPASAEVAAEVSREAERERGRASDSKEKERGWVSPPPAVHGGRFPWPVQGRVLANFGSGANGGHNDGINIAAAKGTPIRAVEGGVVAYAGNELRGYGNLVLIKHPDGLISAYAHCEEVSVKKGETIRPGQVIGRVGATGGVSEPQLHFELRRGKQPVDPREFLAPGPSAGSRDDRG